MRYRITAHALDGYGDAQIATPREASRWPWQWLDLADVVGPPEPLSKTAADELLEAGKSWAVTRLEVETVP